MMDEKRVVLQHTSGRYQGLWQILGLTTDFPEHLLEANGGLPTIIDDVDFIDHRGVANLVTMKQRYVLYREPVTLAQQLNPRQR